MTDVDPTPSWWRADRAVEGLTSPLPDGEIRADVAVVGLGVSGLEAIALLAERGEDVIGLDAHGIAAGAAGANGGFLLAGLADFHHTAVQRHGRAAANAWWHATVEEMDRLEEAEPTFTRSGSLRIAADEDEERDCLIHLAQMRRDGLDATTYDGPEGRGLIIPGDGVVHPVARATRLARVALRAGARLHAPARVQGREDTALVLDGGRRVTARRVLIAVDGGVEHLVPEVAGTARTARLQMLATRALPPPLLPRPVYRRYGLDYFHQRPTGEVLLGGGRDMGGEQEWDAAAVPTAVVQRHLDDLLGQLGLEDVRVTHRWAARAAFTASGLPVDIRVDRGVHVIGAHCGHGNVIGGMLARRGVSTLLT